MLQTAFSLSLPRASAEPGGPGVARGYCRGKEGTTRVYVAGVEFYAGGTVVVPRVEVAHLRARRVPEGGAVTLFNGHGGFAVGVFEAGSVLVKEVGYAGGEARVHVAVGAMKSAARADWCVEKLTELGVGRVLWTASDRRVVRGAPSEAKLARWGRVAVAAVKQSLGDEVPRVEFVASIAALVDRAAGYAAVWILSSAGIPLVRAALDAPPEELASLLLVAGPEGGLTDVEEDALVCSGALRVSLGPKRLRVETAVVAAAGTVAHIVDFRAQEIAHLGRCDGRAEVET